MLGATPSAASSSSAVKASSGASISGVSKPVLRAAVSGPSEFQRPSGGAGAGRLALFDAPVGRPAQLDVQAQALSNPGASRPGGRSGREAPGSSSSAGPSAGRVGQASASNKEASFYSSASDPALSRPGGGALRMQLAGGGGGGDDGVARGFGGEGEGEGGAFGVGSLVPWALLAVAAGGVAYFGNSILTNNKPVEAVKPCCAGKASK